MRHFEHSRCLHSHLHVPVYSFPLYSAILPPMYRIMFICTGNICRSPLAHGVLETLVEENGLDSLVFVESSGTDAYHAGEQVDSRMRATASRHGMKLNHRSRQLTAEDLREYDLLLTMDYRNFQKTTALAKNPEELRKVRMFRDFDPDGPGDVPDPWYGDMDGFEEVWTIVERTCHSLLAELRQKSAV